MTGTFTPARQLSRLHAARCLLLAATLLLAGACRTPQPELAQLGALVDSLLPRLERISALEAREPVRMEVRSREEVRHFIDRRLDEELPPDELAGMHASYAAFGLLPDTIDLRALLLEVYSEQVVGFYDPAERVLVIVEGVSPETIETVIAHELVHALQDQHADLDALMQRTGPDGARDNDRQLAAHAALEGHATLAMFLLLAERETGQPVQAGALPDLGALRGDPAAVDASFPMLRGAPAIVRETLLFPYFDGARFVQVVWADAELRGEARRAPLGEALPASTSQILHPRERFLTRRLEPVTPRFEDEPAGWRVVYENNLGELETRVLLREQLGPGAEPHARGWLGDRYRLVEDGDGRRLLRWLTVWEDDDAADAFADAYRALAGQRPERSAQVERVEYAGRAGVVVLDGEVAVPAGGSR